MSYTARGIDFSVGNGLTIAEMKAHGVQFVCRYLSGGNLKDIDALEVDNYRAAGIDIVLVWETWGTQPSRAQGVADARAADAEAKRVGLSGSPIYFAADGPGYYNPSYMRGVASVLGPDRTGLYADYFGVKRFLDHGIGRYAWQTYAWSGGRWEPRAQLQQYLNGVTLGPAQVDLDRATAVDYGQTPRPERIAANPVKNLHVAHGGYTSLTFAWDADEFATSYTAELYNSAGKLKRRVPVTTPSVRFRRLWPVHYYRARVRAHPGGSGGSDATCNGVTH